MFSGVQKPWKYIHLFSHIQAGGFEKEAYWAGEDRSTTCRPGAWEEGDIGNLSKGRDGEKESDDERQAKHWESCLQQLG